MTPEDYRKQANIDDPPQTSNELGKLAQIHAEVPDFKSQQIESKSDSLA